MTRNVHAINGTNDIGKVCVELGILNDFEGCWTLCIGQMDICSIYWGRGECGEDSFEISKNIEQIYQ